jgi:SagB-type dehydrogenase family enzyme
MKRDDIIWAVRKTLQFAIIIPILIIAFLVIYYFKIFPKEGVQPIPEIFRSPPTSQPEKIVEEITSLPEPNLKGAKSLEEAILERRSTRDYQDKGLNLDQVSQILWAGQGITDESSGFRSAPSAGALYPLDLYLVVGENGVKELTAGVYHFIPQGHKLEKISSGDLRTKVMEASLNQVFIAQAPIVLIITGEYERTTKKYGERGKQYVHLEAGHVGQNIYLQVESLGLGTVTVGAFDGEEIIKILNLPQAHKPFYVMPIGYPK